MLLGSIWESATSLCIDYTFLSIVFVFTQKNGHSIYTINMSMFYSNKQNYN